MKKASKNLRYKLVRVNWNCNANCSFCNIPQEDYDSNFLPLEEVKKKIDEIIKNNTKARISLSGGEPTLRKDLDKIIRHAKNNGASVVQLQTNAILLKKGFVSSLKMAGLDKAFIGFHSHIPEKYNQLMGVNAYEKALNGIRNLIDAEIEVILNPVITTKNYKSLPEYIKFINQNFPEIKSISLSVVQPRGRAWDNKQLIPNYKKIDASIKKSLQLGKRFGITINNPYCGLPLCIGDWWKYLENSVEASENLLKEKKNLLEDCITKKGEKIKKKECFFCDLGEFCNGVWKEYAEIYSLSALTPIKLTKKEKKKIVKPLNKKIN